MAKFTKFVKNLIWLVLVCSWIFTVANAWCPGGGCLEADQVCCNGVCVYESSCLGWYCSSDSDCSFGESCCNSVCVNGSNCLGESCNFESDCGIGEVCCSRSCKSGYSCSGMSCTIDSDCDTDEYCCVGTCGFVDCNDVAVWVVLGSVFGSLFVFVVIFIAVLFICRCQRRSRGRVIEGQRISTGTTVVQSSLPYASLPSYQQAYPYYPPPQYVQYPPYNVGSTKSSELPPPYSGASEETSGGVYTPQTNYGAVSNPSFPV